MADYGIYDDYDDYDNDEVVGAANTGDDPYGQNNQVQQQIDSRVAPSATGISSAASVSNASAQPLLQAQAQADDHPSTPEVAFDGDKPRRVKKRRYKPDDERRERNGRKEVRKMGDCCRMYRQSCVSIVLWIIIAAAWLGYAQPMNDSVYLGLVKEELKRATVYYCTGTDYVEKYHYKQCESIIYTAYQWAE